VYKLAYRKMAGCAIALIPAAVFFLAGMIMAFDVFADAASELITSEWAWFGLFHMIFFLHLVAYFSTISGRGVIALAAGAGTVGYFFLFVISIALTAEVTAFLSCMIVIALTILFHYLTGLRLQKVAAE
jgi:hypothetical protein